jgi:GMP synthase-like glutamine amidotransferase
MTHNAKRILVIQHAPDEHLGRIGDVLRNEGVAYDTLRPDLGEAVPAALNSYSGLIILGGPQSVYEEDKYPFLKLEKQLTHDAVTKNRPIFGVCLGSQILAEVLGSRVYAGQSFEAGWKRVILASEIKYDGVLGQLPSVITPLHWHGDVYDLPRGAVPVGSSDATPVQGFAWQERFYGVLFHIEVTLAQVAAMSAAFPEDLRGRI